MVAVNAATPKPKRISQPALKKTDHYSTEYHHSNRGHSTAAHYHHHTNHGTPASDHYQYFHGPSTYDHTSPTFDHSSQGYSRPATPSFYTYSHQTQIPTSSVEVPDQLTKTLSQPPTSHQIIIHSPSPQQPTSTHITAPEVQTVQHDNHYPKQIHTIHIVPVQQSFGVQQLTASSSQSPQITQMPTIQQSVPIQAITYQQPSYSIIPTIVQTSMQKVS